MALGSPTRTWDLIYPESFHVSNAMLFSNPTTTILKMRRGKGWSFSKTIALVEEFMHIFEDAGTSNIQSGDHLYVREDKSSSTETDAITRCI
jgi:hypothetical protein